MRLPVSEARREVGRRFKADMSNARRSMGMSTYKLAKYLGLGDNGANAIWYVENKSVDPCNSALFIPLCQFFGLTPENYGRVKPKARTDLGFKFGCAVKEARRDLGMTRRDLSNLIPNLTVCTVSNIENRHKIPKRCHWFLQVCDALGLNPKDYGG